MPIAYLFRDKSTIPPGGAGPLDFGNSGASKEPQKFGFDLSPRSRQDFDITDERYSILQEGLGLGLYLDRASLESLIDELKLDDPNTRKIKSKLIAIVSYLPELLNSSPEILRHDRFKNNFINLLEHLSSSLDSLGYKLDESQTEDDFDFRASNDNYSEEVRVLALLFVLVFLEAKSKLKTAFTKNFCDNCIKVLFHELERANFDVREGRDMDIKAYVQGKLEGFAASTKSAATKLAIRDLYQVVSDAKSFATWMAAGEGIISGKDVYMAEQWRKQEDEAESNAYKAKFLHEAKRLAEQATDFAKILDPRSSPVPLAQQAWDNPVGYIVDDIVAKDPKKILIGVAYPFAVSLYDKAVESLMQFYRDLSKTFPGIVWDFRDLFCHTGYYVDFLKYINLEDGVTQGQLLKLFQDFYDTKQKETDFKLFASDDIPCLRVSLDEEYQALIEVLNQFKQIQKNTEARVRFLDEVEFETEKEIVIALPSDFREQGQVGEKDSYLIDHFAFQQLKPEAQVYDFMRLLLRALTDLAKDFDLYGFEFDVALPWKENTELHSFLAALIQRGLVNKYCDHISFSDAKLDTRLMTLLKPRDDNDQESNSPDPSLMKSF